MDIKLSQIRVTLPDATSLLFKIENFEIPFGTKVLIEGASGKGKTTLLHLIAGLFLPDDGYVSIGEHKLKWLSEESRANLRRKHIGIIFQKLNLIDYLSAGENILLALPDSAQSKCIAKETLKEVNLEGRYEARSSSLSLGEQQRVAACRILAAKPDIVLADEPTSSLDFLNAEAVISALFRATEGKTLMVVSHDQRLRSKFEKVIQFEDLIS